MTRDEILSMEAGREMDVTIGYHVMDLVAPPEIYPDYSTDIAAAWEVVEKLENYPQHILFEIVRKGINPNIFWWAEFRECHRESKFRNFIAYAEIAPLAICRAALLAIMEVK